jgi:DNA polymerase III delta subunit
VNLFRDEKRILVLAEMDKDHLSQIEEIIEKGIHEIIILVELSTLPRNKSYTRIKAACTFIELKDLSEGECAVAVRKWLTASGAKFQDEIPSYIVGRKGTNIALLRGEVKKLLLLAGNKEIDQELCDRVLIEDKEVQFFLLAEHFFKKRVSEVLKEVSKVDEYSYVKLLHFLIGQVERLYKVAVYREQGMKAEEISNMLRVPPFIVKTKVLPLLAFNGKMKLLAMLDLFNKLDVELRSSKYPKETVFEAYLLKAMRV